MHPPLHISLMLVGQALGIDWEKVRAHMAGDQPGGDQLPAPPGPSIAEIAAKLKPPTNHPDTLKASAAALKQILPPAPQVH